MRCFAHMYSDRLDLVFFGPIGFSVKNIPLYVLYCNPNPQAKSFDCFETKPTFHDKVQVRKSKQNFLPHALPECIGLCATHQFHIAMKKNQTNSYLFSISHLLTFWRIPPSSCKYRIDPTNLIVIILNVVQKNIVRNLFPTARSTRGRGRSGKTTKIGVIYMQHSTNVKTTR